MRHQRWTTDKMRQIIIKIMDYEHIHIWAVSVLLPGKSHGWRSLEGCSPWGHWGSDTTERLHFHFSLSCIGEGNGNPLQRSCLEIPRDGGAWWAAVYGVEQSQTQLKWLSSSSGSSNAITNHLWNLHSWPEIKPWAFGVGAWTPRL